MSLATYAAPYNNDENNVVDEKKKYRNRTLKRKENKTNPKVEAMMKKIYNEDDEEDNQTMSDFQPLGPPQSMSGEEQNNTPSYTPPAEFSQNYNPQMGVSEDPQPIGRYDNTSSYANQYYQQIMSNPNINNGVVDKDELLRKLNYIIYMLEEQRNQKTDNVMEELILYTFLGVFVIFVVDSFARVGKYVR